MRGRNADRTARVTAHAGGGEACGDGRARAAARAARIAIRIVRVSCLSTERANGNYSRGQLVHVRLGENHCARFAQFPNLVGIVGWNEAG